MPSTPLTSRTHSTAARASPFSSPLPNSPDGGVRRKVRDRPASEQVDVRRLATRRVPQLVHTFRNPYCLPRQYGHRLPGFSPNLAAIVDVSPAMRAIPYRVEGCQHRHGVKMGGRVPAHAVEFRLGIEGVQVVLAVGAEFCVTADLSQGIPVLREMSTAPTDLPSHRRV